MKLKGIELKGTYKVEFNGTYFEVYDKNGNRIYYEDSDGKWSKREYDERDNQTYYEDNYGYWYESEYDKIGNQIYFEDSGGVWVRSEYDERGNQIYYEDSFGYIVDNRVKELTIKEIEKLLGYKIKIKGEKKKCIIH